MAQVVPAYSVISPLALACVRAEDRDEIAKFVVVAWVVVERVIESKILAPEKRLLLAKRVEEAAVMVMSVVPSKEMPLIVRAVSKAVAVSALPVTAPVRLPKIPPEAVRTPVIVEEAFMVEEAVERKPSRKPRVVEVETPQVVEVQAKRSFVSEAQPKTPPVQVRKLPA